MSYDAPPPPQSPYGGAPAASGKSSKGTWALVCGILGVICCGILAIVAIVLGRQAQAEGQQGGTAKAGEILGYIGVALWVIGIIVRVAFIH
jgi:hypothetical protein